MESQLAQQIDKPKAGILISNSQDWDIDEGQLNRNANVSRSHEQDLKVSQHSFFSPQDQKPNSERNSQERFIEKDIIGDGLVFQEQDSFNLSPPAILAPREILTQKTQKGHSSEESKQEVFSQQIEAQQSARSHTNKPSTPTVINRSPTNVQEIQAFKHRSPTPSTPSGIYGLQRRVTEANSTPKKQQSLQKQLSDEEKLNAVFTINGKKHKYKHKSCLCLGQQSKFRQFFVHAMLNKWFDRFIIFCIVVNSAILASKEYDQNYDVHYNSSWNQISDQIDLAFTSIFTAECIVKIIAMGFLNKKRNGYLHNGWNIIDFTIVVISLISITPLIDQSSLKAFRTLRIIRPLRTLSRFEKMKMLINTVIASIPGLFHVYIFLVLMFIILAIIGVQFFMGNQYQFCRVTSTPTFSEDNVNPPFWQINPDARWQCSSDEMCSGWPNNLGPNVVAKCGDIYRDYGLDPKEFDHAFENEAINFDITNFNNVWAATITIFQVVTLEGWTALMYSYQDTSGSEIAAIYFILVVILGSFTTLNLMLASIMNSFLEQEVKLIEEKEELRLHEAVTRQLTINLDKNLPAANLMNLPENKQEQEQADEEDIIEQMAQEANFYSNLVEYDQNAVLKNEKTNPRFFGGNQHSLANKTDSKKDVVVKQDEIQEEQKFRQSNSITDNHLPSLYGRAQDRFAGIQHLQEMERRIQISGRLVSQASSESFEFESGRIQSSRKSQEQLNFPKGSKESEKREETGLGVQSLEAGGNLRKKKHDGRVDLFAPVQRLVITDSHKDLPTPNQDESVPSNSQLREYSYIMTFTELEIEERAKENRVYGFFFEIVMSVTFNFMIYCFIIGNTITLAMYRYDQSEMQNYILGIFDIVFVWIFTCEMIFKLIGFGVKNYVKDRHNIFDGLIVIISLVDFSLTISLETNSAAGSMGVLRALRLFRVLKLARHWKAFQEILSRIMISLVDITNFSFLLLLFMFIAALLGMELFSYSVCYDVNQEPIFGVENIQAAFAAGDELTWPRVNFNNILYSMVTVFLVIVSEDWNSDMALYVRAKGFESSTGRSIAMAYFFILFIIGNTILLALFTALLLKNFEDNELEIIAKVEKKEKEEMMKELNFVKKEHFQQDPVKMCFKNCCSQQKCCAKVSNFVDRFFEIFGGPRALAKRKKSNPRLSASPVSGNAVAPALEPNQLDSKSQMPNQMGQLELLQQSSSLKRGRTMTLLEMQQMLSPDHIESEKPLQRSTALLHYDYDQVKMHKKTIKLKKPELFGSSLYICKNDNPIRRFSNAVSNHWIFETLIIVLIFVSTISLAFEHPLGDPHSDLMNKLGLIDQVITSIFCAEALMKIITVGFIFNGRQSYILLGWNVLDFLIVMFSVFSLSFDASISFIKVFRVARILRPLRLIQKAEGLKITIQSLYKALPQILRLQVVVMFFMFIISILLTTLLSGKFSRCDLDHTLLSKELQKHIIKTSWDCADYGGQWVTPPLNFDNTLQGMLTLFIFQTKEGWIGIMWDSVDATGVDMSPVEGANPGYIILYMFLVILLCLLLVNMFVGIVIETYNKEKDGLTFNQLLTVEQRAWIKLQLMTYRIKPVANAKQNTGNRIRSLFLKVSENAYFENFVFVCILFNTIAMALLWFDQPKDMPKFMENINYFFISVFTAEAVIKIVALGKAYFYDSWNRYDFTIVVITIVILSLQFANIQVQFGVGLTVLRSLRIGRIIRLVKYARKFQIIFETLFESVGSLGSLGLLMMILFFMFAIIGRNLFGLAGIKEPNVELNEHVNFRDLSTSFLLLFRCSTGESWHGIMFDFARTYSQTNQCRENETYETMMQNGGEPNSCGSPLLSYTYFVLFSIVFQIFLNLFIAIIIDVFLGQSEQETIAVQKNSLQEFVNVWSVYDPDASGFIKISEFENFIVDLTKQSESKKLVILADKIASNQKLRRRFIAKLKIPTFFQLQKVMFYDVLQQLCDSVHHFIFNSKKIKLNAMQNEALIKWGINTNFPDELALIMVNDKSTHDIDFEKTIRNMGRLNNKVKLIQELQSDFTRVHETMAVYADTESNFKMNEQERRALSLVELQTINIQGQLQKDDINLYTTMHYIYGTIISRSWRKRHSQKLKTRESGVVGQCTSNRDFTFSPVAEDRISNLNFETTRSKKMLQCTKTTSGKITRRTESAETIYRMMMDSRHKKNNVNEVKIIAKNEGQEEEKVDLRQIENELQKIEVENLRMSSVTIRTKKLIQD